MKHENENVLHDERYKFYCALTKDEAFRRQVSEYKMRLSVLRHSIPWGGLPNEEAMEQWIDSVHKDYYAQQKSESYLLEEHKITNGKERISLEESDAVDALREQKLPPYPYHAPLTKILEGFIHDRELDDHDFFFITKYVLMEKVVYAPAILTTRLSRDDHGELELWVRIYPHTRQSHIKKGWDQIIDMQKDLRGYKDRFRPSPTIQSDEDDVSSDVERSRKNRRKQRLGKVNR